MKKTSLLAFAKSLLIIAGIMLCVVNAWGQNDQEPDTIINAYFCTGTTYSFNDSVLSTPGVYPFTIHLQNRDSLIELHLIEIPNPDATILASHANPICAGLPVNLYTGDCAGNEILNEDFSCLLGVCATCGDQWYDASGNVPYPGGGPYQLTDSTYTNYLTTFPFRSRLYPAGNAIKLGAGLHSSVTAAVGTMTSQELDLSQPLEFGLVQRDGAVRGANS